MTTPKKKVRVWPKMDADMVCKPTRKIAAMITRARETAGYHEAGMSIELGEMICKRLKELHWTRERLAIKTGTSKGNLTNILRGSNVCIETIAKLSVALGMAPELSFKPMKAKRPTSKSK